ncbi:hypothetical protein [Oleiharenicola sp. Vm1]|uniref:hypothetical protein n=1 Tax=Oleiharenicola sp. Vm1 TaxID=3398393 RepID=UPI0039F4C710
MAQAAGLAYARGAGGADFVSRYSDLFAAGVIANGVIALRLAGARWFWVPLALAWGTVAAVGLHSVNTTGHAHYFHEHSAGRAAFRESAITAYLRNHNSQALVSDEGRGLVYPDPATVTRLLDDPRFVRLLPDRITLASRAPGPGAGLAEQWKLWLALGGLLALAALTDRPASSPATALPAGASPLVPCALLSAGALGAVLLWPRPWAWRQSERWENLLYPTTALRDLRYEFVTATTYPIDRLDGAANLAPESLRNLFVGTHLDGPDFTGTARSQPFTLESPGSWCLSLAFRPRRATRSIWSWTAAARAPLPPCAARCHLRAISGSGWSKSARGAAAPRDSCSATVALATKAGSPWPRHNQRRTPLPPEASPRRGRPSARSRHARRSSPHWSWVLPESPSPLCPPAAVPNPQRLDRVSAGQPPRGA